VVISATSTEYIHIAVTAPAGVDLITSPVRIAVVAHRADPADDEWHAATWDSGSARILVGPGGDIELAPADYRVWINVDPPGAENVVRKAGILSVT
jgi:hypothetical protein